MTIRPGGFGSISSPDRPRRLLSNPNTTSYAVLARNQCGALITSDTTFSASMPISPTGATIPALCHCGSWMYVTQLCHAPCALWSAPGFIAPCQVSGLRMKFPKNRVFKFDIEYSYDDEEEGPISVSTYPPKKTCTEVMRPEASSAPSPIFFLTDVSCTAVHSHFGG